MKFTTSIALLSLLAPALAQSSSSASASASASGSASSSASAASPSASGNSSAFEAYLQQVLGALTAANLTQLVTVAGSIATIPEGQALLAQLAQGNKTVFAPNDAAFANVSSDVASNPQLLTQILSYHILNNTYTAPGVAVAPNHTIARTLLRGGNYSLPGNRTAPVVLAKNSTNATTFNIIQATSNLSAAGPAQAANLNVYIINQVLTLPPSLGDLVGQLAPGLSGVIGQVGLLEPLTASPGLTIFAPNDAAINAVASTLGMLNQTQIQTVLANHVINGTVAYSDRLTSSNYTSAAGSPFTFMSNSSGTYVMSANSTAKIIQTDIIYTGGVVHVIDAVLANTNSNSGAAASAYSSNAAAATSMEPTAPVTASSSPASASGSGGASGSGAASSSRAAGDRTLDWNLRNLGLGAVLATIGVIVGGGAVLL